MPGEKIAGRTLSDPLDFSGIGIHSGKACRVKVLPAKTGGLCFFCDGVILPAESRYLVKTAYGMTLERDGHRVGVVEHLLAVLFAFGVTDALLEADGEEVPILDGSAAAFVSALSAAGTVETGETKDLFVIERAVEVRLGERWLRAEPCKRLEIDARIEFPPPIGRQRWKGVLTTEVFAKDLAVARSFGFLREREALLKAGLGRGASLDNALVFDEDGPVPPQILRFPDEPVRHKVLDQLGDLALLGAPFRGRLVSFKGGHELSARLLAKLRP